MSTSDNQKQNMATDFKTLFNLVIVLGLGVGMDALTHYPPGKFRLVDQSCMRRITDILRPVVAKTSNTQLDQGLNGSGAPGIYSTSTTPDSRYGEHNCQYSTFSDPCILTWAFSNNSRLF